MTASVDELMHSAVKTRQRARTALETAVHEARAANWSWDRISTALGGSPDATTSRRAFAPDSLIDHDTDAPPGCGADCQMHLRRRPLEVIPPLAAKPAEAEPTCPTQPSHRRHALRLSPGMTTEPHQPKLPTART
jgi:hypothetical protein